MRVKTGAREEKVESIDDAHFIVSVKAVPVDGRATTAVMKALAHHLGVASTRLALRSGGSSKSKVFLLSS